MIQADATINWNGDTKTQGRIMGEARALRAILYFDLVRLFGDVPLLLTPSEENIPRTPAKEVYQAIFDDLKYAAENIPADAYPLKDRDSNDGRITKYAAEALMARAYLYYTGYYGEEHPACSKADATAAINDVVDNGGYELERIMPTSGCLLVPRMLLPMAPMLGRQLMQVSGMTARLGRQVRVVCQRRLS